MIANARAYLHTDMNNAEESLRNQLVAKIYRESGQNRRGGLKLSGGEIGERRGRKLKR